MIGPAVRLALLELSELDGSRANVDSAETLAKRVRAIARKALEGSYAPVDMILYCPACGTQHVDAPKPCPDSPGACECREPHWTNPPHRSHLCATCKYVWRPADVPTNGVQAIATRGKNDTTPAMPPRTVADTTLRLIESGAAARMRAAGADVLLGRFLTLCAVGDVDEDTEAFGWGELIRATKTHLDRVGRITLTPNESQGPGNGPGGSYTDEEVAALNAAHTPPPRKP